MNEDAALPTNEPGDVTHADGPAAQACDPAPATAAATAADSVVSRDLCLLGASILVHIMQIDSQLGRCSAAKQSDAPGRAP